MQQIKIPQTEQEKRNIYFLAFGKQFDDPNRKQMPLSIDLAVLVAMHKLETEKKVNFTL